jgi:phytoene dehydrogenase-like protein
MKHQGPISVIVGAGLSGLACALTLQAAGRSVEIIESAKSVGGRVRTDVHVGPHGTYLLDRGFQVLLTAYPEARRFLDYEALGLSSFFAGADVRFKGRWHRVADPLRHPLDAARGFVSPIASLRDKARLGEMFARTRFSSIDALWIRDETTAEATLSALGFDKRTVDRFFRPFFGGVFFDSDLRTSSRMLDFTFRMFSAGSAALPARGMQAIPDQLAARLVSAGSHAPARIRLNVAARHVRRTREGWAVELQDGTALAAESVVLALPSGAARSLVREVEFDAIAVRERGWVSTTCVQFDLPAEQLPGREPMLRLNAEPSEPGLDAALRINHLCFPSQVSTTYAPPGRALCSASLIGVPDMDDAQVISAASDQLQSWFGPHASTWTALRVDRIREALPDQRLTDETASLSAARGNRAEVLTPGLIHAGDHVSNASIDGALGSGRVAAELLLASV